MDKLDYKVITNHHQANVNAGEFTCTENGLYKFQVYSLTKSNSSLFLELYVNNKLLASLWGHTTGDYASAGNAVITSLVEGDVVSVKTRSQRAVNIFGKAGQIYTTFTGVQLGSLEIDAERYGPMSVFSVGLTQHQEVHTGQNVLYNNILTDTNTAYSASTGVYTVPSSGLYIFHFFSFKKKGFWQELFHNNIYVCSIYGLANQDYADAGNTVLLHLKENDQISVRAHRNSSLFGTSDQIYSTFSGTQLVREADMSSGQEPIVAFSVGLSHHVTVTSHTKVIFDRVFLDLNSVYDKKTGEFTAPVGGLYEFNFHALGKLDSRIWLELFHNYRFVIFFIQYVYSLYSHTPGHYATGGNAVVLELDAGDVVYVNANGDVNLFGGHTQIYCTFTGYLLFATSGPTEIIG
ncbi:uncharacterized protein LOC132760217 [Ruditapes philippinarum]|uniref:uncharacterized protein LOC132760217 n=1 Tax=Ruditapes philippinarum TaxID=129788 RepID=UPI00295BCD08|nr:uncharacterized protein LOC132760217 [Ruditapes philippinarum]